MLCKSVLPIIRQKKKIMVQTFCVFTTLEDDCHKRMFTTKNNNSPKRASQLQTIRISPGFESEDAEEEEDEKDYNLF